MGQKPELDSVVSVRGVGQGYVASVDDSRVVVEFIDETKPITIPRQHLGTDCYQLTGDVRDPFDETVAV